MCLYRIVNILHIVVPVGSFYEGIIPSLRIIGFLNEVEIHLFLDPFVLVVLSLVVKPEIVIIPNPHNRNCLPQLLIV